jgi:regulator of protease activity HflC (stomatin/prohibitin superfamily)
MNPACISDDFSGTSTRKEAAMFRHVIVCKHERGLRFRKGDFIAPLGPGRHTMFVPPWDRDLEKIEVVDTLKTRFDHPLLDVLILDSELREQLVIVELGDTQRGVVYRDKRVFQLIGPGRHAYWKSPAEVTIEVFDIAESKLSLPRLAPVLSLPNASMFVEGVVVSDHENAIITRDGKLLEVVGPGLHLYWKGNGKIAWKSVDLREQSTEVSGQEIITADRLSLRINLLVSWQVTEVLQSAAKVADVGQAVYREAQLALRSAVGTRTLDQLLEAKDVVGRDVYGMLRPRAEELGVAVKSVGLKDIILPGDMKLLLNQVIAATKEAEANLIRRREETAAARSQANTARLLSENPQLMRLKELEMLKDVLNGTNATFVLGPGDLSEQLKTLVATK